MEDPKALLVAAFTLGVRLLALGWLSWGCFRLIVNLLGSYRAFDPTYAAHFFWSQLAVPGTALVLGVILWVSARWMGKIATGFLRR